MLHLPESRWKAFATHIAVSALLFIFLAGVIYFLWYPGFLFEYDGGLEGIRLIAGVDFLIGPILTLCIYKLGKPGLKFDLVVIALLQIACLSGGMYTVWKTRPVAVVYASGQFRTISYQTYSDYGINPQENAIFSGRWPIWFAVKETPSEHVEETAGFVEKFYHQTEAFFKVDSYVPYDSYLDEIRKASVSVSKVVTFRPDLRDVLNQYGDDALIYELASGAGSGYLFMDQQYQIQGVAIVSARKSAYAIALAKCQEFLVKHLNLLSEKR